MTEQRVEDGLEIDMSCSCDWCQARAILMFARILSERRPQGIEATDVERALLIAASGVALERAGGRAAFAAEALAVFDGVTLTLHDAATDKPH